MSADDLSELSMLELFRMEAESQTQALTSGLLALERDATAAVHLEACMRAAHSLKGAANLVGLLAGVSVTHAMEDCFVAAQHGRLRLRKTQINLLLQGVDLITRLASGTEAQAAVWSRKNPPEVEAFLTALTGALSKTEQEVSLPAPAALVVDSTRAVSPRIESKTVREGADRVLRVTARNLDRLLGLAGESLVDSRWLAPFSRSLMQLKRQQQDASKTLEVLRDALSTHNVEERAQIALAEVRRKLSECEQSLSQRLVELDSFERRSASVAHRLYEEALACRMRPFADGIQGFPRMVRDLAYALGKQARLEIVGESTQVDRDVLERLEGPLNHLLRNAVDHGIGAPAARLAAGKSAEGVVRLEARHVGGMLQINVSDDGQGIDIERVRSVIVERGLIDPENAAKLRDAELYDFLLLPGFTIKEQVTEISGRGVGLDAVHTMVKQLRGSVRASSQVGNGALFQLLLPLTVSVVRTVLVEVGGEPYAFPLVSVQRMLMIPRSDVETLEGRQHFAHEGKQVGLVAAYQLLDGVETQAATELLPVIVVADHEQSYGLVVDRFLGARELVVQPLDPRLGKVKDISAGALLEDGAPVLIIDVEDLIQSIQKLISAGHLSKVRYSATGEPRARRKRVLVVDDSLTVRELERKLIDRGGYEVEVAVDGVDGWNAVRGGDFNLVVTDVDMPRMDGIELVRLIRHDPRLQSLPVMIVSYKDREEDRQRGLEAGADFYLAKGSFHNESLLRAVVDLIGEP